MFEDHAYAWSLLLNKLILQKYKRENQHEG